VLNFLLNQERRYNLVSQKTNHEYMQASIDLFTKSDADSYTKNFLKDYNVHQNNKDNDNTKHETYSFADLPPRSTFYTTVPRNFCSEKKLFAVDLIGPNSIEKPFLENEVEEIHRKAPQND
jgi:hypothetical protein